MKSEIIAENVARVHTHTHTHGYTYNSKGITLIALVITIVVLLILAGISISLLFGDNGILVQAESATTESRAGQVKELVQTWYAENGMEAFSKSGKVTKEDEFLQNLKDQNLVTEEEIDRENKTIKIGKHTINYKLENITTGGSGGTGGTSGSGGESVDSDSSEILNDWVVAWVQTEDGWDETTYYPEDKTDEQLEAMGTIVARIYENSEPVDTYSLEIVGSGQMSAPEKFSFGYMDFVGAYWREDEFLEKIVKASISEGITCIPEKAFYGFWKLTSFEIPNSVTEIEYSAFLGTSLTNIHIPNNVTTINSSAINIDTLSSATFENTSGWYVTYLDPEEKISIDVTNPSQNAIMLKNVSYGEPAGYSEYTWKRVVE